MTYQTPAQGQVLLQDYTVHRCTVCGRVIRDHASIAWGIGPDCLVASASDLSEDQEEGEQE